MKQMKVTQQIFLNYKQNVHNILYVFFEIHACNLSSKPGLFLDAVDFRSPVTATELNRFIADKLQPTEEFNYEMQATVGKICSFLQEHMRPNRIVKVVECLLRNGYETNINLVL